VKARLDLAVTDLGPTQLKNIAEPIRVYSLQVGAPATAKPTPAAAPEKSAPPRLSIVVLPFKNLSSDSSQDYFWLGGSYGDFGVADGSPMWRRGWRAAGVIVRSEHDAVFRGRGCERRVWAQRLERVCGGREDIAFLLRRARGGEGDKHSEAGSATMIMRCRS
jgi:hypothetical protein